MKKILAFILIIIVNLVSVSSALSITTDDPIDSLNTNEKKWTLMYYGDGDWEGGWPLTDFLTGSGISSGVNVDIIALDDVPDGPAKLWYIDNNSSRILLEEKGEINMGDYVTLRDFILFCKTNYPAERYVINLWDHGGAWEGACMDITNVSGYYDIITMDEMQRALQESGGVDIIGFSACVMGCIESVYELRDYTDVYIGSEEMHGMGDEWVEVADVLEENPDESTYNISYKIIELFKKNNPYFGSIRSNIFQILISLSLGILPYPPALTVSAVRTDKIEELVSSINNYSDYLMANMVFFSKYIRRARLKVDDYARPMRLSSPMGTQIDIIHFVNLMDKLKFRLNKPELHLISEDIKNNLDQIIINEYHQIGHRKANGLSIYFPPKNPRNEYKRYNEFYANCSLDFTNDTHWDEFLEHFLLN